MENLNYLIVEESDNTFSIILDRDDRKVFKDGFLTVADAIAYWESNDTRFKW